METPLWPVRQRLLVSASTLALIVFNSIILAAATNFRFSLRCTHHNTLPSELRQQPLATSQVAGALFVPSDRYRRAFADEHMPVPTGPGPRRSTQSIYNTRLSEVLTSHQCANDERVFGSQQSFLTISGTNRLVTYVNEAQNRCYCR